MSDGITEFICGRKNYHRRIVLDDLLVDGESGGIRTLRYDFPIFRDQGGAVDEARDRRDRIRDGHEGCGLGVQEELFRVDCEPGLGDNGGLRHEGHSGIDGPQASRAIRRMKDIPVVRPQGRGNGADVVGRAFRDNVDIHHSMSRG